VVEDLQWRVVDAHGGLERWNGFETVSTTVVTWGQLWDLKSGGQDDQQRHVRASPHNETLSLAPYGDPAWHMTFTPERVAVEAIDSAVVLERADPRPRLPITTSTRPGTRFTAPTSTATRCGPI
jgi:hypothetical protein